MTIVSSGNPISINSLVGEYGGSSPHSLSEYYKGGSLVGNHAGNPNVPTSGAISLSNFYGASNTAPFTADTTASFVAGYTSVTIGKTTTYYRGYLQTILASAGSVTSNSTFQYTSGGATVTLSGAYAHNSGSSYGAVLQIDGGGSNHTIVNGKTCTVAGVNMGTIPNSWTSSTQGNIYQVNLGSNQQTLYNAISNGSTYTVSIS